MSERLTEAYLTLIASRLDGPGKPVMPLGDARALLAEVKALRQERDEARAALARAYELARDRYYLSLNKFIEASCEERDGYDAGYFQGEKNALRFVMAEIAPAADERSRWERLLASAGGNPDALSGSGQVVSQES